MAAFLTNSLQQVWKLATAGRTKDLQIWKSPAILATYWQLLWECAHKAAAPRRLLTKSCHSFCSCLLSCSFELQILPFEFLFEVMLLYARTWSLGVYLDYSTGARKNCYDFEQNTVNSSSTFQGSPKWLSCDMQ